MGKATEQQAKPSGKGTPITDLLIHDLIERDEMGTRKYGEPLKAFNGRDPLVDAYQELIDLLVYLRQYMEESKVERAETMTRMLRQAAEDAYRSEVVDSEMTDLIIGEGKDYANKENWIESWLECLREDALGSSRS